MKKYLILIVALVFSVGFVVAGPNFSLAGVNPSNGHASVVIPSHAVEVAPGVFSLGSALDVDGSRVEGFALLGKRNEFAKPGSQCGNGICEPGENAKKCAADCGGETETSTCYAFLANGAKWKDVEPYVVNPSNVDGLSESFVVSNLANDIDKWEGAAGVNILGVGSSTTDVLVADMSSPDGVNEVYFADVGSDGAIAVTIVWGIFRGPPSGRKLVEWDQVYDDVDFDWSSVGEAGKMDFGNIATHELGHTVGMGHPSDGCTEETMFRFASAGETKKRSLESGDKTGVSKLYN